INESLNAFPYVNGKLFEEHLPTAAFDSQMRKTLMDCCLLDWGKISPAIFGSLFQSVMDAKARRNLGAHYTSEKNILKLIKPLFLDELYAEYKTVKDSKAKLQKFHDKMSSLRFLDPACGCGNFLIIAYRELRLLEIEIIKQRLKLEGFREEVLREAKMDVGYLVQCDVDRFYGIEYEEFPAQIAQVAMWLADHQMNQLVSNTFGEYYVRLPLRKSATIVHGNALRTDWQSLLIKESTISIIADEANLITLAEPQEVYQSINVYAKKFNYVNAEEVKTVARIKYDFILGNPPFIGSKILSEQQKKDMLQFVTNIPGVGSLDYVAAWYIKAAKYMNGHDSLSNGEKTLIEQPLHLTRVENNNRQQTKAAFVSTNSITQGEQVAILWNWMTKQGININFAHRTFQWSNEAKGVAAVHCVIIGFENHVSEKKMLFEYKNIKGEAYEVKAKNINPYLVDAPNVIVQGRSQPLCNVPLMFNGSIPADGGNLIIDETDYKRFVEQEPLSEKYLKRYVGAEDYINDNVRYCLWLVSCPPNELRGMPHVMTRVQLVKEMREASSKTATKQKALTPTIFTENRQPKEGSYLAIPRTSSTNRKYIPIGFLSSDTIAANDLQIVPNAKLYHFGMLMSEMHMAWVKYTCGRLKSDIRYSAKYTYNTYPWPENPTEKQIQAVEAAAQNVLDARAQFPEASLADLYDPNTMPPVLVKAHQALDKAVDLCYRPQPFINETKRIEFLFELYDKYTSGMFADSKKNKPKKT
ncbi:MAG: DNA methyltransferase, partial [Ferruginibacter sp.]